MALTDPSIGPIAISTGRSYPGGHSDADVEALAHEDGQAGIHRPSRWGENTHPHAVDLLNAAHETNAGLIAHQYREDVRQTVEQLDAEIPKARSAEQAAHSSLEEVRRAALSTLRLRHAIERDGLELPSWHSLAWIVAGITLLFLGETGLVAASFQVFGLSDQPAIPGIGLTDDLHVTAYASVTALLVLAHLVGHNLRLIEHHVQHRPRADNAGPNSGPRGITWFRLLIVGVSLTLAVLALDGLATVRADYLRAQGEHVHSLPFIAIQVGIFAAAAFLVYLNTHPHGRRWARQLRAGDRAEKFWHTTENGYNALVGSVNAKIDLLDALLAQAGHHVRISGSDVRRQGSLYARRAILSQHEATAERLLPSELPTVAESLGEDPKRFLIGITAVPAFERLSTDTLVKRQEEIRAELRELENRLADIAPAGTGA